MLNGAVGYQMLDDGTPFSLGLILISAAAFFIGVGYIALDTGFDWTGFWNSSTFGPDNPSFTNNRDYALYTLYQLVPLVFLFIYFVLESLLVLRILGERRPMRTYPPRSEAVSFINVSPSLPNRRHAPLCYWPSLPICHQRPYLQWYPRQDQRRSLRNLVHFIGCIHDMGVLVEHYGGRLAGGRAEREHVHIEVIIPWGIWSGSNLEGMALGTDVGWEREPLDYLVTASRLAWRIHTACLCIRAFTRNFLVTKEKEISQFTSRFSRHHMLRIYIESM